jgi:hypothetical protein
MRRKKRKKRNRKMANCGCGAVVPVIKTKFSTRILWMKK